MRFLFLFAACLPLFLTAASLAEDAPPQDRLALAVRAYNEAREKAIKPIEKMIRDRIDVARNKGDLDTKKLLEASLETLMQGGLPELKVVQGAARAAERELVRAKSRLLLEYQDVEREFVRQGDDAGAEEVRAERSDLDRHLTEAVFTSAERRKAGQAHEKPVAGKPLMGVFLSDLPERNVLTADPFGKNGNLGFPEPATQGRIIVGGVVANKGIATIPFRDGRSTVTYDVPPGFSVFKAIAAMNDSADPGIQVTPCTFKVMSGNDVLWSSLPLRGRGATAECEVQLKGNRTVTLVVECPGLHNCAHAVWVDPCFLRK